MNILVISAHPDDETLGSGGALLRYKKYGHKTFWLNFTNIKEEYGYSAPKVKSKNSEIEKVKKGFGFSAFYDSQVFFR